MDWELIRSYSLVWAVQEKRGEVHVYLDDDNYESIPVTSISDLAAYAQVLRGDRNVYFNRDTKRITTGRDQPG